MIAAFNNPAVYSCIGCMDAFYTNKVGVVTVTISVPDPSKLEGVVIPFRLAMTDNIETVFYDSTVIFTAEPTAEVLED